MSPRSPLSFWRSSPGTSSRKAAASTAALSASMSLPESSAATAALAWTVILGPPLVNLVLNVLQGTIFSCSRRRRGGVTAGLPAHHTRKPRGGLTAAVPAALEIGVRVCLLCRETCLCHANAGLSLLLAAYAVSFGTRVSAGPSTQAAASGQRLTMGGGRPACCASWSCSWSFCHTRSATLTYVRASGRRGRRGRWRRRRALGQEPPRAPLFPCKRHEQRCHRFRSWTPAASSHRFRTCPSSSMPMSAAVRAAPPC